MVLAYNETLAKNSFREYIGSYKEQPMAIEQTVEIPTSHRLTIDVPQEIPAGPVVLTFTPAKPKPHLTPEEAAARLRGMCKGSTFTVDKFLEEGRQETLREEAEYRRLFHHADDA
jgi:hypothetical protein